MADSFPTAFYHRQELISFHLERDYLLGNLFKQINRSKRLIERLNEIASKLEGHHPPLQPHAHPDPQFQERHRYLSCQTCKQLELEYHRVLNSTKQAQQQEKAFLANLNSVNTRLQQLGLYQLAGDYEQPAIDLGWDRGGEVVKYHHHLQLPPPRSYRGGLGDRNPRGSRDVNAGMNFGMATSFPLAAFPLPLPSQVQTASSNMAPGGDPMTFANQLSSLQRPWYCTTSPVLPLAFPMPGGFAIMGSAVCGLRFGFCWL
ncbi:MAG: hypothetical protein M1819_005430 [Sarea resinae]|nr:MAG: hypothetical protein M1819_005430 [Sarea resinae]